MFFVFKVFVICLFVDSAFARVAITRQMADSCPNEDISNSPPIKLQENILCEYENGFRPVKNHTTPVIVNFSVMLKHLSYDVFENALSLNCWYNLIWKDEHLRWNPNDYDGIDTFSINCWRIWRPDLAVLNLKDESDDYFGIIGDTTCYVNNNGTVITVAPHQTSVLCLADLTYYPYDTQKCTIYYGSWSHTSEKLNWRLLYPYMELDAFEEDDEWKIVGTKITKEHLIFSNSSSDTYPTIKAEILFKRLHAAHAASFIIPLIVLVSLTLLSLWIEPISSERYYTCSLNVILHFLHLQAIYWTIPLKGNKTPLIITFTRDSLLMCTFVLISTVILRNLLVKKTSPPACISALINFILSCKFGQLLFSKSTAGAMKFQNEDDAATIVNSNTENQNNINLDEWRMFTEFIDKCCFLVCVLIYLIMIFGFLI